MAFDRYMEGDKNLFDYHAVFAASLAAYLNLKKDVDSNQKGLNIETQKVEALSILRSNILYAVALKINDAANSEIKNKTPLGIYRWVKNKESEFLEAVGGRSSEMLDVFFLLMVEKQEIAGLTATSDRHMTSRMNMQLSSMKEGDA